MHKLRRNITLVGDGLLNSYGQIFFSNMKIFSILLLIATFLDPAAGLCGVIAVLVSQATGIILGYSAKYIKDGTYTYNSLMVGLVLGYYYELNTAFWLILVLASVLTFFITIRMISWATTNQAPFLSIPFLLAVWAVLLSARGFASIKLAFREDYAVTQIWGAAKGPIQALLYSIDKIQMPELMAIYFKSMGAILFQYNLLAGIIVTVGLLIFSRMSFTLSILGFGIGYLFYTIVGVDFTQVIYSYIGFNFILSAIALGGFFIVPSVRSYLLVILVIPMIAITISALDPIFQIFQLPLYSFPFNLVVILLLLSFNLRVRANGLDRVIYQQFSPELNHYKSVTHLERFRADRGIFLGLPFLGKWNVSQGHKGEYTHKEDWTEAWDFVIKDNEGFTYREPGTKAENYFCFNIPVCAPADGYVVEILDGINDNNIGEVNLDQNWGNTIVIKHGPKLFSQLSHIKKGSFKVAKGDYVRRGEVIATCGSSGRSPEPHLHFQLQKTPFIGSKTLRFPITYYLSEKDGEVRFNEYGIPNKEEIVSNIQSTKILQEAYHLIPGKPLVFRVENPNGKVEKTDWTIEVTPYNQSYIQCNKTKARAYFVNNETLFFFTDFQGTRDCFLYQFYLANYKVLLGYYKKVTMSDNMLLSGFFPQLLQGIHDFTAPFFHYLHVHYGFQFTSADNDLKPLELSFKSEARTSIGSKSSLKIENEVSIDRDGIKSMKINNRGKWYTAERIS